MPPWRARPPARPAAPGCPGRAAAAAEETRAAEVPAASGNSAPTTVNPQVRQQEPIGATVDPASRPEEHEVQPVHEAFWFAVAQPRTAVDEHSGARGLRDRARRLGARPGGPGPRIPGPAHRRPRGRAPRPQQHRTRLASPVATESSISPRHAGQRHGRHPAHERGHRCARRAKSAGTEAPARGCRGVAAGAEAARPPDQQGAGGAVSVCACGTGLPQPVRAGGGHGALGADHGCDGQPDHAPAVRPVPGCAEHGRGRAGRAGSHHQAHRVLPGQGPEPDGAVQPARG